ncbi:MAG: hypothetical protein LBP92_07430, partial [Deltaproteobacteria bacterium]|nr:hypothetical protein [Deltaproteobacteria bacterium]
GVVQYLSGDEEARLLADYEEMARRDEADRLKGAYKKGYEKGLRLARQQRKAQQHQAMIEIAQKGLLMKYSVEFMVRVTGLSLEEVNHIAASLKS